MSRAPSRLLLLALGIVAIAPTASAVEVLEANAGPLKTDDGVYYLDAKVLVDARPVVLRHVITNLCAYKDRMEHLSYCRVFRAEGQRAWSYAVVALPVLDPRDYVIQSTIEKELAPDGRGTYRSRWESVKDAGPRPRKGCLRLRRNEGSWTLSPAHDGAQTLVHYEVRITPGGIIPAWVAGYVAKRTLPDYMRLLETISREEEARGSVLPPVPGNPWSSAFIAPLEDPLPALPARLGSPPPPPPGF